MCVCERHVGSEFLTWLRGIGVRQVRLACGLVLFTYIFSHFFNHALGNVSLPHGMGCASMSGGGEICCQRDALSAAAFISRSACGRSISAGISATRGRNHAAALGLSIPLWSRPILLGCVFRVCCCRIRPPMRYPVAYWVARPHMEWVQFALLTSPGRTRCIGLYFWLRLKPMFKWAWPIFFAIAVSDAAVRDGRRHPRRARSGRVAKDPQWYKHKFLRIPPRSEK